MSDGSGVVTQTVPFRVTDPERIPAKRYYDAEFYRLEGEKVWPHSWQMACRLEQIREVGDWIEYSILGHSVIVVRTRDGVRAHHNVCRHRGVALVKTGDSGNCRTSGFICPFHGWRWDSQGKNVFVYGRHLFSDKQLDETDLALKSCRVEEAIGCAFINFDDNAPSLRDTLGPVLANLEGHHVDKLRAEWSFATVLPANWKVAMEAFMEGYHVMRTHPQLHNVMGPLYNSLYGEKGDRVPQMSNSTKSVRDNIQAQFRHMELLSEGMAGMAHAKEVAIAGELLDIELPDDPRDAVMMWYGVVQDQISRQLRARGEPIPDLNAVAVSHPIKAVEFLFPNYFLLPFMSSFASYRIRPLGPESCLFELWSLTFFPEGQEPEPVMAPTMLPYDSQDFPPIPRQDYENIPRQQIGLHAQGFEFMRLSKEVEGLISNFHRVVDLHLEGADPDRIAAATRKLAGGFDGPIVELDS